MDDMSFFFDNTLDKCREHQVSYDLLLVGGVDNALFLCEEQYPHTQPPNLIMWAYDYTKYDSLISLTIWIYTILHLLTVDVTFNQVKI